MYGYQGIGALCLYNRTRCPVIETVWLPKQSDYQNYPVTKTSCNYFDSGYRERNGN